MTSHECNTLTVEMWPIERIAPYARNPRKNEGAVDRMVAAIQEFGFKIPVLVRGDGELVDGHLRLKAAHRMGLRELPVVRCDEWSAAQVRAFRLMVNRSASWAGWDEPLLALELAELQAVDFDLSLTGFDGRELDALLFSPNDGEADRVLKPQARTVSIPGDLWICGNHRLLCGDATVAPDVARLLSGRLPHLMVTDPPYGVEYDPGWRERAGLGVQRQTGRSANDDRVDWSAAWQLFGGDVAYVWHAGVHAGAVAEGLSGCGFRIRSQIIWSKPSLVLSRGHYHWQHEPCWYAVRAGRSAHWTGDRTQSTVWEVPSLNPAGGGNPEEAATGHSAQKPVELMRRPILNHTQRGEDIYDPFAGSGTTLMAAELTGRCCLAIEVDPVYVDLAVRRWQQLGGREAVLDGEGGSFTRLEAERVADKGRG